MGMETRTVEPGRGRPSKGARRTFVTLIPSHVASALERECGARDITFTDYIAGAVSTQLGYESTLPARTGARVDLPIAEELSQKRPKRRFVTRIPTQVAEVLEVESVAREMAYSEFIAVAVAQELGYEHELPPRTSEPLQMSLEGMEVAAGLRTSA